MQFPQRRPHLFPRLSVQINQRMFEIYQELLFYGTTAESNRYDFAVFKYNETAGGRLAAIQNTCKVRE
jgi:hypothetical protein